MSKRLDVPGATWAQYLGALKERLEKRRWRRPLSPARLKTVMHEALALLIDMARAKGRVRLPIGVVVCHVRDPRRVALPNVQQTPASWRIGFRAGKHARGSLP